MEKLKDLLRNNQWADEFSSLWVQWGGLLCVVIIFCFFVLEPYMQWRESEWSSIQQKTLQLNKLKRLSDSEQMIHKMSKKIDAQYQTAQKALLDAKTHTRAIGQQVDIFDSIYRSHGLKFVGRRFDDPSDEPWLGERVDSQWRLSGASEDILLFLYDLASVPKLMEATRIEIKPGRRNRSDKDQAQYEIALKLRSYRVLSMRELQVRSR